MPPARTKGPGGRQDSAPSGPVPGTTASPSHVPPALSWAGFLLVLPSHDRGAGPGACSGLGLGPRSPPRRPLLLRPPTAGSGTVGRPEALVLPGHGRSQLFPPAPETRVSRFALVQSSSQKPGTFLWLGCLVARGDPSVGLHCGRAGLGDRPHGPAALPSPPIPWAHPPHVLDRQQGPEQGDVLGRGVSPGPPQTPHALPALGPGPLRETPSCLRGQLRDGREESDQGARGPSQGGLLGWQGGGTGASWGRVQSST